MICFQGDQVGIAPRMFKALIGRGHPEFSTNRQQDAQEFFLHFVNMVEVSNVAPSLPRLPSFFFSFPSCAFTPSIPLTEELPLWAKPIWSIPLPGGGKDCVPAVSESQIYPTSGLHSSVACANGPGHQHRWEDNYVKWLFLRNYNTLQDYRLK